MKKTLKSLLCISVMTLASGSALAEYTGPGATSAENVAAINKAPVDDMQVVLVGKLIERVNGETYLFSDDTGTIPVEIDYEDLPPVKIDENTQVRIEGEVEAGSFKKTEIEVERLTVI